VNWPCSREGKHNVSEGLQNWAPWLIINPIPLMKIAPFAKGGLFKQISHKRGYFLSHAIKSLMSTAIVQGRQVCPLKRWIKSMDVI
jgi:hypothetical protein